MMAWIFFLKVFLKGNKRVLGTRAGCQNSRACVPGIKGDIDNVTTTVGD